VGGTLVVTLTQGVLAEVQLEEGDRVLVEALPPSRILISEEAPNMPSTRRTELQLQILEAKRKSLESQTTYEVAEYNLSGSEGDSEYLDGRVKYLQSEKDKVALAIAEKNLELFELQGA
jgi:hypothetical protein